LKVKNNFILVLAGSLKIFLPGDKFFLVVVFLEKKIWQPCSGVPSGSRSKQGKTRCRQCEQTFLEKSPTVVQNHP
jgi:hypothetical protein